MRVEVARDVGQAGLTQQVEHLERRHGTFEALRQRVLLERCDDPDATDDYLVWKALRDDGSLEERVVFDTPDVFGALTPRRVELLEYLHGNDVASIKELAARLRRDYKNTYDDLVALQAWGLVGVRRHGKNQRPFSLVTSLRVGWEK